MGKQRVIAETGAGQHGVATATACAHFGLDCVVYMGEEDIRRQAPNVFSMKLLGAEVRPVTSGSKTLRDAINEAMRDWMASVETTHYILGSVVGPHPFPRIVRDFQSVIGREAREQSREQLRPPARSGRGLRRRRQQRGRHVLSVHRRCARSSCSASKPAAAVRSPGDHASPLSYGSPGVLHGSYSYVMQDDDGQTCDVHSISAGLDYPGVGPEHSYWKDTGRVTYTLLRRRTPWPASTPSPATKAFCPLWKARTPFFARWNRPGKCRNDQIIVVCLSGRGDKDAAEIARLQSGAGTCLADYKCDVCPTHVDQLFADLRRKSARPSCRLSRPAIRIWSSRPT